MKVRIRDIGSSGLTLEQSVLPHEIGVEEGFLISTEPVIVTAIIDRAGEIILANVELTACSQNECARCLAPLRQRFVMKYQFDFEPSPGDEFIDLGQRICEEIVLGYSSRILCKEDCLGLCCGCGADLNKDKCQCKNKNS
jgi:uncharacterized protein